MIVINKSWLLSTSIDHHQWALIVINKCWSSSTSVDCHVINDWWRLMTIDHNWWQLMTSVDEFGFWTQTDEWTDGQTDRRSMVVVKSILRLKIRGYLLFRNTWKFLRLEGLNQTRPKVYRCDILTTLWLLWQKWYNT